MNWKTLQRGPDGRAKRNRKSRAQSYLHPEALEPRALLATGAVPLTTLSVPARSLIGEAVSLTVGFSDAGTGAGFGPYVDLFLPTTGDDGKGMAATDGVSFVGATYLGQAVTSTVLHFDSQGHATHPYAEDSSGKSVVVSGTPGDELVVLQLPFGSYTPGQPAATIDVSAHLSGTAPLGAAQAIQARGGFRYGNDPLDDAATDPTIIGTATSAPVNPALFILTDTYNGPEDETATGPNFPRSETLTLDVANGQTITNLDVGDVLPDTMQFLAVTGATVGGSSATTTSRATPSTTAPGGTLTRRFASVTGTTSADDASLTFSYYIPQKDGSGNAIVDPTSGAPGTSTDAAQASGTWAAAGTNNTPVTVTSNAANHVLTDKSIATQETVADVADLGAAGPTPGDTLRYTINFQVSDYFALQNLLVSDLISDGQHIDPGYAPTLQFDGNSYTQPAAAFGVANYTVAPNYTGATPPPANPDGTTTVAFRVSDELAARGHGDPTLGGLVPAGGGTIQPAPGTGPTTGTITFQTIIQDKFTNNFPSGEANVDHGDELTSAVTAQGGVLADATLAPTGGTASDTSGAGVTIVSGGPSESIYAINGNTAITDPARVTPGDAVTYRLQYTLPASDEEQLAIYDYLPLPIFYAPAGMTFNAVGGGGTAVIPAAGSANFGPADTFFARSDAVPTLTADATSNSLKFAYPAHEDPANSPSTIDLLFTVTASDQPFADGLFLTDQEHVVEGTTNTAPVIQDRIIQVQVSEPSLTITKGAVATNDATDTFAPGSVGPVAFTAPGSAGKRFAGTITSANLATKPIASNVNKVQANDLVTFAVVLQNVGSGPDGAFNVSLKDAIPAGFAIPTGESGLNLDVTDGTGAALAYTDLGGGLFGTGIELDDPGASAGALAPYSPSSGANLVVITYDLVATQAVSPNQAIKNTATLTNYASAPGGPDFAAAQPTASATANTATPKLAETLTGTSLVNTSGANLAIGEVGTYTALITVPEETIANAKFVDTLPAGLAIVGVDSVTLGSNLSLTSATPSIGSNGSSATVDFGTITNGDTAVGGTDTITVVFRVVALDVAGNRQGTSLPDAPSFTYTGGSATATPVTATAAVPAIQVTKSVDNPHAQAGDTVTYTITLQHAVGSGADAFNVDLTDALPAGVTYVAASLGASTSNGVSAPALTDSDGLIIANYAAFPIGGASTLTFQGVVGYGVAGLTPVTNTANLTYTSEPFSVDTQVTPNNPAAYERTGNTTDPGGSANNLSASGSASFTPPLTVVKAISGLGQSFLAGNRVAIGEQVHYRVTVTVPQGTTPTASLSDALPPGLAIVSLDGLTPSSGSLSTSIAGGFAQVLANAQAGLPAGGGSANFDFGTLTNTDTDSSTAETITLDYTVVVLNVAGNQSGTTLTNAATFHVPAGSATASAPAVTVETPVLQLTTTPSATAGDAGGAPITFTVTVAHAPTSTAEAFNVDLTDLVPAGFTLVAGSVQTSDQGPDSLTTTGGNIAAAYGAFPLGATATLTFQATLNPTTTPGQVVTDTAGLTYTTIPEPTDAQVTPNNPAAYERTGNATDPGGAVNDLDASASAQVTVNSNTLAGTVYDDVGDAGSRQEGDPGVGGVTVTLTGIDNLGNAVSESTTTATAGAVGSYAFTGLRPGRYAIVKAQPGGYLEGRAQAGTPFGGTISSADAVSAIGIPLGTNAPGAEYDFGLLRPAGVSGTVFSDPNNNGTQNDGEPGIPGATVSLTGFNDLEQSVTIATSTDDSGHFGFTGLRPGTYTITETRPPGYLDGKDSAGNTVGTLATDVVGNFTLAEGQQDSGVTFGNLAPGSLSGSVYVDANDDGIRQETEAGVGGVTLTLTGTDDLGHTVDAVVATGPDGLYSFAGLRPSGPAGYTITETPPLGFFPGRQRIGTPGGDASVPGQFSGIAVMAGTAGVGNNFGELIPAGLSGSVYVDANDDGIKQSGEAGLGGVTLTLTGTDDLDQPVHQVTTTLGTGAYGFSGLRPGIYAIAVTQPGGYVAGLDTAGTPAGSSTATPGVIGTIALASGIDGSGNNFGELPTADLSVTQAVDDATPNVGQDVTFTVTLSNSGPSTATNVALADTLPAGLALVSAGPSLGTYANGTWTVGTVAPGATPTLTIVARVDSPNPQTNVAAVAASDQADPTAPDNSAGATETPQQADLGVTMTLSDPTPNVGEAITYMLTLTDHGPDAATAVEVDDFLPTGLDFVSANPGQGTYNPATGAWAIGSIADGAATTLTLVARVTAPVMQENGAVIAHSDQFDPNTTNGIAFAPDTPQPADLAVAVSVGDPTPDVGEAITYTVTLSDNGPNDATGVAVTDLLPAGLAFVSAAPSQGAYDVATGRWTVGAVDVEGQAPTLTITARVVSPEPQADAATIAAADQYDPVPANNAANAAEAPPQADLSLTQAVDDATPAPGDHVTLTLILANAGPDAATGVTVADLLPAGLSFVSAAPGQGTYDPSAGLWSVGSVLPGATKTLTIVAAVSGPGVEVNTAQVEASGQYDPDSTPGDNNPAEDDQASVSVTPTSTLSGSVYVDANRDGLRQPGEAGVGGVALTLSGTDGQGHPVHRTTESAPGGGYAFAGLLPGTYAITETPPIAYNDGLATPGPGGGVAGPSVIGAIPLGAGVASPGYDFAEIGAAISGRVTLNSATACGCGADGFAGVVITLEDASGAALATTTTAADGSYSFPDLPAGPYRIVETPPAGYGLGTPAAISAAMPTSGLSGQNFDLTTASLAGTVYSDANDDGRDQAGERGLAGVTVTLTGRDAAGAAVARTTRTGTDGSYCFSGLLAGTYTLAVTTPGGDFAGRAAAGMAGGTAGVGRIAGIPLAGGVSGTGNNFGELAPARLAGTAFFDTNGDGRREAGEPALAGVPVTLTGLDDLGAAVVERARTGSNGTFAFAGLRPGHYALAAGAADGDVPGRAAAGAAGGTAGEGAVGAIRLAAGVDGAGYAFPEHGSTIAGNAFGDVNGDGTLGAGDSRLGGVTVTLKDAAGQTVATTKTAPDGSYRFTNIPAGDYTLFVAPEGAFGGASRPVSVAAGKSAGASLALPVNLGRVVGSVFQDRNDDGAREPGEPGVGGVPIGLTGRDALGHSVARSSTTAADGSYHFAGLPAGSYTVAEGRAGAGGLLVGRGGPSGPVRLAAGATAAGPSFAEVAPASLSGAVYLDGNRDGSFDPNDFGIAHVAITLAGVDDLGHAVSATTSTADDGTYTFAGLRPGTYSLTESEPSVFIASGSPDGGRYPGLVLSSGADGRDDNFGELARPGCRLQTPLLQAILREGPHPMGAPAGFALRPSLAVARAMPLINFWLPTLAARFNPNPPG